MKCTAIVPARWHTPAHQCPFDAVNDGLCAKHAKMRCAHSFDRIYRIQVGSEFKLLSWCPKCGTLSITDHEGAKLTHPENYALARDVKIRVYPAPTT